MPNFVPEASFIDPSSMSVLAWNGIMLRPNVRSPEIDEEHQRMGKLEKLDWTYTMRRDMQEVIPGLFLGPYSAASRSKLQTLKDHGITHIVCVRHALEINFIRPNFPSDFKYLVLEIANTFVENIMQHFKASTSFIDDALASDGRVLVHGSSGTSRSATLVLAYIMETYNVSLGAYTALQERRFCINPNRAFLKQLEEYEPIYKAEKALQNEPNSKNRSNKRTIQQIENDNVTKSD
ncbi:PREDICTED: serine/threonine/tyrosine-interacting protein B-like isoform X2 [Vollenhovia emeryi]|uniref:serine/threonine/tyrosine-interacting protein B-like isoform X2 n=1 Tax=Vollenhovia emeryi TaxID=411798 RepID=UPI0005F51425|nr:PREDICTED: serine/threonine/tyrosine-interacting protein B-like isoform X2 [Vollenhovia emeryi]